VHHLAKVSGLSIRVLFLLAAACGSRNAASSDDDPPAFPDERVHFDAGGHVLGYVANRLSDTITVIDLDAMAVLGESPVGRDPVDIDGPRHATIDRQRGVVYVTLSYPLSAPGPHEAMTSSDRPGYIQALSLSELAPVGELRVDPGPVDLALLPDQSQLAVLHDDPVLDVEVTLDAGARRSEIALIDSLDSLAGIADGGTDPRFGAVCIAPGAVVYGKDKARAYVACTGEDTLAVVDTGGPSVLFRVPAGPGKVNKPFALTADDAGARLLLSNQVAGTVALFTTDDPPAMLSVATVTGVPFFSAWISDSQFVVPIQGPSGAAVVDAASGTVLSSATYSDDDCNNPSEARAVADGRLFLVCEGDHYGAGSVVQVDPATLAIQAKVTVGIYPDRLAVLEPRR